MKRINAFTIAEVVVVLILSLIVLSTIFTVLYIVNRQNGLFNKSIIATNQLLLAEKVIRDDVFTADSVKKIDNEGSLRCYTGKDSISYYFDKNYFKRLAPNTIDTFKLNAGILYEQYVEETSLIEQINLQMDNQGDTTVLVIQKSYDAVSTLHSSKIKYEGN